MSRAGTKSSQGDDFQIAVVIHWLIRLLSDDNIAYIQAESNGISGFSEKITVDDIVIGRADGSRLYIQAKKNQSTNRAWSFADLGEELVKSKDQLLADLTGGVHFYSATPFGNFESLAAACREYPDFPSFQREVGKSQNDSLGNLAKRWGESLEHSFELAQRIHFGEHLNYEGWGRQNSQELSRLVTKPKTAVIVLESLINAHQSKRSGTSFALRKDQVIAELRKHCVVVAPSYEIREILLKFAEISLIGRDWNRSVGGQQVARPEIEEVFQGIGNNQETILIVDRPGSGKTCFLLDIVERLESDESFATLFLKGDRFIDDETRAVLPGDIVEMCARLAEVKPVVVIIDSLDVLSLNRDSGSLNFFLNMIDRLQGIENITLVAACRTFDLQYDAKLRDRNWKQKIELADFDFDVVVAPLLYDWGVDVSALNAELRRLLCLPQNLRLFEPIAALDRGAEIRSAYELQAVFLDECVRKNPDIGTLGLESLQQFAYQLLRARVHQLPNAQFAVDESIRRSLISQNVLFEDSGKIAVSHQTLFDALVVQQALTSGNDLLSFISAHPPFPFLRASVQTFVFHLRFHSPELFSRQIIKVLNDDHVAYHLKRLIVETIGSLRVDYDEDWPLVRRIYQQHPVLFERMFWKTTGAGWFRLLLNRWLPLLGDEGQQWKSNFLRRLGLWANDFPDEVVMLWLQAINDGWGGDNAHEFIVWQLSDFSQWNAEQVEALLSVIAALELREHNNFLDTLSRYLTDTGRGYELLWRFMTRNVTNEGISRFELNNQLDSDFKEKGCLEKLLSDYCQFLDLVLADLEAWAHRERHEDRQIILAFVDDCPSYERRHSRQDLYHSDNLAVLLAAVEAAISFHANQNTEWWQNNELMLRNSNLLLFQYFLIKPYQDSPLDYVDGINALLTNPETLRYGRLSYEIGELIQASYFLLPEEIQIENQSIILDLYLDDDWPGPQGNDELPHWVYRERYNYLLWIPIVCRTKDAQDFVLQFEAEFGRYLPEPDIGSRGGTVGYPLSLEQLLSFRDSALISYCQHYEGYDDCFGSHPGDHLKGGQGMVQRRLSEAAAYDPSRYLQLLPKLILSGLSTGYPQSIVQGVAHHLRYRYGNVSPSKEFKRVQPEVDGEPLAKQLLALMEQDWLWEETRAFNVFIIPEACCDVLRDLEGANQLVLILFQHYFSLRVHSLNSSDYPESNSDDASRRVRFDAINSDWGHIGSGATKLCNGLLEAECEIPELLFPLLRHLVKTSEKAAITVVDHIPYMAYKKPEWGFQLFSDIYDDDPPAYLWGVGQRHLYYQYHNNFEYVQPYLERMLQSNDPEALQAWGLLSTMSHLSGHISQDHLFNQLISINEEEVWIAAAQVFEANLDKHVRDEFCINGLTRILELELGFPRVLSEVEDAFDPGKHGGYLGLDFARLYITKAGLNEERWSARHLLDWIADLSNRNPIAALELMEILAEKLSSDSASRLYDGKSLIQALNTLLREADETDDEGLIARVIGLQDSLLQLDLYGIEDFFRAAEKH